jgi:hypothetical protein
MWPKRIYFRLARISSTDHPAERDYQTSLMYHLFTRGARLKKDKRAEAFGVSQKFLLDKYCRYSMKNYA